MDQLDIGLLFRLLIMLYLKMALVLWLFQAIRPQFLSAMTHYNSPLQNTSVFSSYYSLIDSSMYCLQMTI